MHCHYWLPGRCAGFSDFTFLGLATVMITIISCLNIDVMFVIILTFLLL